LLIAGKANSSELADFKSLNERLGISTDALGADLSMASKNLLKLMEEKLKNSMVNKPANDFKLTDLDGKIVSLADYKGKVVILDFWATWCVPCKASFPAMQQAFTDYKDDDNVKFLFVHTFPRSVNPREDVAKYLKESGYTFRVLMDETNTKEGQPLAAKAFGVESIPSKFVIDRSGNIRFRLTGFDGDTQTAVKEIKMMVDLIRNGK